MSVGYADAKFPNQPPDAIPPSPSRENPGAVYPKSGPNAAPAGSVPGTGGEDEPSSVLGNPFAFQGALNKLGGALNEVITALEGEAGRAGVAENEQQILRKFRAWAAELRALEGRGQPGGHDSELVNPQEGPLFTD
ncbi:uncharacterized protein PHACADRAFT_164637 [Phanerochaete carnosa HHB-10118-sp]|uniref:Uncharacterized protein n=1 Tax=Phanerochaete carnosa (strain HHB-10118-sp) TaxID=650164 RepID=K5WQR4_PHACS|nr:uncharacterized protein PHACADRAFT_164637 [Phanerochaete carnosa HHB-10118-sp]EKM52707.1 hypothetical protein PHACADRAFT_164637 [Phanerochaete carnosa HHB-10118-sp]